MVTSLIQLVARMTKLGWFEEDAYRTIVDDSKTFLDRGTTVRALCALRCALGVWGGAWLSWSPGRDWGSSLLEGMPDWERASGGV